MALVQLNFAEDRPSVVKTFKFDPVGKLLWSDFFRLRRQGRAG